LKFDAASLDMFSFQLVFILDATKIALNYGWVIVGGAHSLLIGLLFFQLIVLTLGFVPIFLDLLTVYQIDFTENQIDFTEINKA
jgi:uncharacterized membrane protein YedE/YeeE